MDAAPGGSHPLHRGDYLIVVPYVGSQTNGGSSGVLNFEFCDVEFALAAAEKPDACASLSEAYSETLAYAATGARNQDWCIQRGTQKIILPDSGPECRMESRYAAKQWQD